MNHPVFLSIGLMSGTSMDGIDAALLKTDGSPGTLCELAVESMCYTPQFRMLLKAAEYSIRKRAEQAIDAHILDTPFILSKARENFSQDLEEYLKKELKLDNRAIPTKLQELGHYLHPNYPPTLDGIIQHSTILHGSLVIKLLQKTGREAETIDVVGCHGQAFFHRPSVGISIVLNNGQELAEQVGIPVVNDFRRQDIAAGGQGAPFAPLYHQALAIRDKKIPCAVVNCGGIANVTYVLNDRMTDLIGFDTGPGNGLIDQFVRQRTNGRENMDKNGQYGQQGKVNDDALKLLYQKSLTKNDCCYFFRTPPKSLDIGDMELVPELDALSLEDGCATLEAFTADTIVYSLRFLKDSATIPQYWILTGGGWNNPVIREQFEIRLKQYFNKDITIQLADEVGWNSQAMEAQIFAYLAVRSLQNKPLSVPGTTRVPHPLSGGSIFIPIKGASLKL